ncbi:hypothetical protein HDU98_010934 [Podochytrium sp. JEL0797]|nr:hypothetical protein HDU98_010934 [Podochytrium sp. JEL0797]
MSFLPNHSVSTAQQPPLTRTADLASPPATPFLPPKKQRKTKNTKQELSLEDNDHHNNHNNNHNNNPTAMSSFSSTLPPFSPASAAPIAVSAPTIQKTTTSSTTTTSTTTTKPFSSPLVPLLSPPFAPSAAKAAEEPHSTIPLTVSKCCTYCSTRTTPMWRHGPVNFNPLCNGCGVKWKRGRILVGLERAPKESAPHVNKKQKLTAQPSGKTKRSLSDASFTSTSTIPTFPSHVKVPRCLLNPNLTTPLDFTQTTFIENPSYNRTKSLSPTLEPTLPPPSPHATQIWTRQQMLLESTFARSPPPTAISTISHHQTNQQDDRRSSISSPVDLEGPSLRSAFVCAALETLDSKGGALRKVADAVLWIRRRSLGCVAGGEGEGQGIGEVGGLEEEGEVDVGSLGVEDWEYLCGVLVNVE